MADAELRFKAVLDDDASRGIDKLADKTQDAGTKAAKANSTIGSSATTAATKVNTAAGKIGTAYQRAEGTTKRAARGIGSALTNAVKATSGAARWAATRGKEAGKAWGAAFKKGVGNLNDYLDVEKPKNAAAGAQELGGAASLVTAGGLAAAWNFSQLAAEAEQNIGAVTTVFGEADRKILDWSKNSVENAGMSSSAYQGLANALGGSLTSAGWDMDTMASKSNDLLMAAADLSSVFGGTATESAEALGAALRGEFDSLERWGVFLTAEKVNAELAARGQDKLSGSALEAAKKQATVSLIMEQAGKYTGNFAREANTASGAQQRATAAWEEARIALGQALLPVLTAGSNALRALSGWAIENQGAVLGIAGAVLAVSATITAAIGAIAIYKGALAAFAIAQGVATAAVWLFNTAMKANVIVKVVTLLFALGAAVVWAYKNVEWFRDAVDAAWAWIKDSTQKAVDFIQGLLSILFSGDFVGGMGLEEDHPFINFLFTVRETVIQVVENTKREWATLVGAFAAAGAGIAAGWEWTVNAIRNAWEGLVSFATFVKDGVVAVYRTLTDAVVAAFTWMVDSAIARWQAFHDGFVAIITAVKEFFAPAVAWLKWQWDQFVEIVIYLGDKLGAWFSSTFSPYITAVTDWFTTRWAAARAALTIALDLIRAKFQAVATWWTTVWNIAVTAVTSWFRTKWDAAGLLVRTYLQRLQDKFQAVINWWRSIWNVAVTAVSTWFRDRWNAMTAAVRTYLQWLQDRFNRLMGWWNGTMLPVIRSISAYFRDIWNAATNSVKTGVQWLWERFQAILSWWNSTFGPGIRIVASWFSDTLGSGATAAKDAIGWLFDKFSALVTWISRTAQPVIDNISKGLGWIGEKAGSAWQGLSDFAANPMGGVQDWLGMSGGGVLPGGMARASGGLVLPGYTPGRDQTPILASAGEAVLVPELVRAIGPSNIMAANHAASGGRKAGSGPSRAAGMLSGGGGGITVSVQMDVNIQGNADTHALAALRGELESAVVSVVDSANRRGY